MSKINAIIVDDELSARENLTYLLNNFCKEVCVVDVCRNVDEALLSIKNHKPDVVFLDIEMPQKNGFQLLKEYETIDFQVVFITAYDQYAVKAFEVAALDYLLKPIDIERLVEVISKIKKKQVLSGFKDRILALSKNRKKLTKISIPYKSDYVVLDISSIICIQADRMYSHIYTMQGEKYTASKKLGYYEELFKDSPDFQRVHRSWVVNISHLKMYSKSNRELHVLDKQIPVSKLYKEEVEKLLGK